MNFGLSMATNSTHKSSERNDFLLVDDILQICRGTVQRFSFNSLSRFTGILQKFEQYGQELCMS